MIFSAQNLELKSRDLISRFNFEILKSRDFPISIWLNEILKMQKVSRLKTNLENIFYYRDPKSRDGEYDPETNLIFLCRDLRYQDFASRDGFSRFISRW